VIDPRPTRRDKKRKNPENIASGHGSGGDEIVQAPHKGVDIRLKSQQIIVFGTGEVAELADFYFTDDSGFEVVAFTVDAAFMKETEFRGRPVVPFERVGEQFPPECFGFFVAVGYGKLNAVRAGKVAAALAKGYRLVSYVSSRATVFPGFDPKENCFILEDNTIQPFASIGANVTLWSGNHIGHHSIIEDDVFLASHVVVSGGVRIGHGSFVGVNVTIRDHIAIGKQCVLGAGALVLEDQPDFSVVAPRGTERSKVPSTRLRKL
jgi:sugar O-acyltransferase (sialic acid O-acetyltransferase NeuD family)